MSLSVVMTTLSPALRMSACGKPTNRLAHSAPSASIALQRACSERLGSSAVPWRITCGSIGRLPQAVVGLRLALEHAHQRIAGAPAGVVHVDMRIGLVAGDDVGMLDHLRVEVGMHVVADGDRRLRVDGADAREQRAFAVLRLRVTIAPCRSSRMPSQPPRRTASRIAPLIAS